MLKASLGFVLSHGARARSLPGHHVAIIEFLEARIDKKHTALMASFDRLRRKRNMALYDDSGMVTRTEAKQSLETALQFIELVEKDIGARRP